MLRALKFSFIVVKFLEDKRTMKEYIKEKYSNFKLRRQPGELKMAFFDSIEMASKNYWNFTTENVYLTYEYLKGIELMHNDGVDFRYVLFFKDGKPVAKAAVQIVDVHYLEGLKQSESKRKKAVLKLMKENVSLRIMICGSAFSNGENGFEYLYSISKENAFNSLATALYRLRRADKVNGQISAVMLKDFWPESKSEVSQLKKFDYRSFEIEPNMVVHLKEEWKTFDDYLASLTSKYRSKVKSVYKKSKAIDVKSLNAEDLKLHHNRLDELFKNVYSKADFKLVKFEAESFVDLKQGLGEKLIVNGYFKGELLVGFGFSLINGKTLDFNYVGIDYDFNREYALYQRMMFDQVKIAIEGFCEKLQLGRTATEIKSSLGAIPYEMKVLVRHRNTLSNKFIKPIIKSITAPEVIVRDPFKK